MSPLSVLHITPYGADAWSYGGIPRVADTLTRSLVQRGHDVTLCATDACSRTSRLRPSSEPRWYLRPWNDSDPTTGVTTHIFPNLSNGLAYHWQLFTPVGLAGFVRRHAARFDVAHLHAYRNLPGVIAARELRRQRVPFILAPNGTAPRIERRRLLKRAFDGLGGDIVLRHASRVLAVTQSERGQLLKLGVADHRICVVPNPIDVDEFREPVQRGAFRRRVGIDSAPIVMFLGKLTPRKRTNVLVEAFARLGRPSARLVIAGNDMGSATQTQALADARGIRPQCLFTGLLTGRARMEALTDADVVVYPSAHEVFGLVPLESLMCGTPVIVADDCGCGEIIRETGGGDVTPVGDGGQLAAALGGMLDNLDMWRVRARAAGSAIPVKYGAATVTATLESVYREACEAAT